MNTWKTAIVLVAIVAISGCSNSPFGRGDDAASTANAAALGGASDPSSPAYFRETVGDRVLFQVDQAVLTDAGRATLEGQARWLIENTDYTVTVEGHADEQGTREYNIALGARRADAAKAYLVSRGVAENRLSTISYGKERPLAVCSEESCYQQNRRAVTILGAGGPTS